ncbi:MAG: hypothetical protein K2Y14_07060 [Burkholderiales bacterium]|nr:hypothetical protein [Burkholderiales bacterium]
MNFLNKNTWRNLTLAIFGATTLAACGGAGSCATCSTPTPNANLALTFTAPAAYPAGIAVDVPVMVTNTSNVAANNVVYSIDPTTNTTHGSITISPASQTTCANLAAHQSCQLVAQIAATPVSTPGAFSIVASSTSTQSTLNKVVNFFKLNATGSNLANASVGLVALPTTNTEAGANGITLYYPTTALAESGTEGTNIMVTAVVTSANAGNFNTINLVDGNGELLNFRVLTGNSGNDLSNLPIGSIVTFLVNIPQGSSQLQFQTQTATTTGGTSTPVGNPSTSPNSKTVTLVASNASAGILNLLPNYFNLTTSYESQIITLTNTGNGELSAIVITPSAPLTTLSNNCAATLAAGATCQYTVGFDKTQPIAGTSLVTVDYTSAGTPSSATATVNYEGRVAGLTITSGTNPNFDFTTRTAIGSQTMTSQVTLTNTGRDAETLSSFTLPPQNYFGLNTAGIAGTACTTGLVLAKDESCNINLVYTNGTVTSNSTTSIVVNYTYTVLGVTKTASSSVGLTYQTLQSLASLTVSPPTISFATPVLNNAYDFSVQTITISNNSDTDATNVDEVLSGTNSGLFNIVTKTSDCTATLAAHTSCTLNIQFGPFESSTTAGSKEASLDLSYNNSATTVNNNTPITAQSETAHSAIITTAVTGNSGFTGAGTSGAPYSVNQNAAAPTVTITVSNGGTVPATDFYITPSSLGNWTLVNNNCGTSGSGVTLNASGTCTFGLQLATATAGAQNYALSNIAMDWVDQDSPTGQTQNMSGTIYANVAAVTPPATASIAVSVDYSSWDNGQTGGTLTDPLLLHYIGNNLPMAFIDLTYTNTGAGAANSFTSTLVTLPNGWSLRTHGCNAATLAATNGTCTDQYKFVAPQDIHATGTEFDNGNVKLSWNDGTPHESQVLTLPVGTAGVGGYNTANVIYNAVYLDMFVSTAAHNGQFSTAVGGDDAIANADILCTGDAQNTLVGTDYKALLVAKTASPTITDSRYACTTQACNLGESYNWVLQSNLRYSSLSNYNQIIGMTNASSIFPSGADINKIFVPIGNYIWTGLATSDATSQTNGYYGWMTSYPGYTTGYVEGVTATTRGNCNNWTSNTAYDNLNPDPLAAGDSSKGNQSGYNAFAQSSQGCNDNGNKHYLLCVQQP